MFKLRLDTLEIGNTLFWCSQHQKSFRYWIYLHSISLLLFNYYLAQTPKLVHWINILRSS